ARACPSAWTHGAGWLPSGRERWRAALTRRASCENSSDGGRRRRLGLGRFPILVGSNSAARSARRMDTAGYGGVGKRSGRGGAIPLRWPALSTLPTLGETGRARFPITARVADPSRLWAVALLSCSACFCGVDLAAGPTRGGQSC